MTLPDTFFPGLVASTVFGLLGIILLVLGYKVFDWLTPKLHLETELGEKHNVAVAIVVASIILGVAYICAHVVK
jgi:putative membrane protein